MILVHLKINLQEKRKKLQLFATASYTELQKDKENSK